ncbi:MAG TPA: hypothetical protein VJ124_27330 [Pyrinomonadaceae bacterium]|nr:hypothetical protein [Pyrinomonadaceae bacterium]
MDAFVYYWITSVSNLRRARHCSVQLLFGVNLDPGDTLRIHDYASSAQPVCIDLTGSASVDLERLRLTRSFDGRSAG